MLYKLIFITIYICISNIIIPVEGIDVQTDFGTVRGKLVEDDITRARYYSFQGMPYAEPPVGKLRFKPPVQRKPSSSIIDATKPGYVCPQTEEYHSRNEMNEDCLNFNIYTPADKNLTELLPVIFNIHGGYFSFLSGKREPVFSPELLIKENVVVVSINHRLGALGFLSLCTKDISGNAGLKDVLLALKITHANIEKFGGDPNKITISGDGSGAVMAELLMLTKQATGLFQRVVLYSGSVLSPEFMQLNPRENALLLGRELGLDLSNDDKFVKKLKSIDPFDIIKAQEAMEKKDPRRGYRIFRPFKPVVEIEYEGAVLTRSPLTLLKEGTINDVPMVIGFNDQESLDILLLLEKEPQLVDKLNNNWELLIPEDIKYPKNSTKSKNLVTRIRNLYFNGGNINLTNIQPLLNLLSDIKFSVSIDSFIELYKETKKSSVYYYLFAADTELNWFKAIKNITYPGVAHLDKIGYYFFTSITKSRYQHLKPDTILVQTRFIKAIKNFMDTGKPFADDSWPEAGPNRNYIHEAVDVVPVYHNPFPERLAFWKSVYGEFRKSKFNTAFFCCKDKH